MCVAGGLFAMTKQDLLTILLENASEDGDHEIEHSVCDKALLEYINDPEITAAFAKGTKWYA